MAENKKTLVMFSGGKDSFLTACRLAEQGDHVTLLSFNNGAVVAEEHLSHGAARLKNRYRDRVTWAGVYPTIGTLRAIDKHYINTSWKDLGKNYPDLSNAQVNCLHCQTAMWIAAIAYCKAKNLDRIAAGYKSCDPFCTGMPPWINHMKTAANSHGLDIITPLWETPEWGEFPDTGRDREMEHHMFLHSVLEPQCTIGRPVPNPTPEIIAQIERFFRDHISPFINDQITELTNILRCIKLSDRSLKPYEYQVPDGSGGLY